MNIEDINTRFFYEPHSDLHICAHCADKEPGVVRQRGETTTFWWWHREVGEPFICEQCNGIEHNFLAKVVARPARERADYIASVPPLWDLYWSDCGERVTRISRETKPNPSGLTLTSSEVSRLGIKTEEAS